MRPMPNSLTGFSGEYVRRGGSPHDTHKALGGLTFPFFPPELQYMARRSSLRHCLKTAEGYVITPGVIDGLAGQLELIETWKWGGEILIEGNHDEAVNKEVFVPAYELHQQRGHKAKGRAVYYEPLDLDNLLWCVGHEMPRHISGHRAERQWVCDHDYHNGIGPYSFQDRRVDHQRAADQGDSRLSGPRFSGRSRPGKRGACSSGLNPPEKSRFRISAKEPNWNVAGLIWKAISAAATRH